MVQDPRKWGDKHPPVYGGVLGFDKKFYVVAIVLQNNRSRSGLLIGNFWNYFITLTNKNMKKLNVEKMEMIEGGNAPLWWWWGCVLELEWMYGMSNAGEICHLSWDYAIT